MGTEGEFVLSEVPAEVVGNSVSVGRHRVGSGGILGTDIHGDVILDVHIGTIVGNVAVVADENGRRTEHVLHVVGEPAVEFSHEGVGLVDLQVTGVVEVIGIPAGAVIVGGGIHILISEHQFVLVADIPVEAGENVVEFVFNLMLGIGLTRLPYSVVRLVMLDDFVGELGVEGRVHFVADINRSGKGDICAAFV